MAKARFMVEVKVIDGIAKVTDTKTKKVYECKVSCHGMDRDKTTNMHTWYQQYVDISKIPDIKLKGRYTVKRKLIPAKDEKTGRLTLRKDDICVVEYSDFEGRGSSVANLFDII